MSAHGGCARHDDPDIIALNCRMAGELGADIIKTDWCTDTARFSAIATQSLAPIALAGGPAKAGVQDVATYARAAIAAGATPVPGYDPAADHGAQTTSAAATSAASRAGLHHRASRPSARCAAKLRC